MVVLLCNGGEDKGSNDTPTGEGGDGDGNKIEEINEAHPRDASSTRMTKKKRNRTKLE